MKNVKTILFYGSIWGILEASLGALLHLFFVPLTGILMFPIGFLMMRQARLHTEDSYAPIKVAAIAASIKLINLLMVPMWIKVVNPAVAILFEGLFVLVFMGESAEKKPQNAFFASYGWRLSYLAYLLLLSFMGFKIRLLAGGFTSLFPYLTLDALLGAGILVILTKVKAFTRFEVKLPLALFTGALALLITLVV